MTETIGAMVDRLWEASDEERYRAFCDLSGRPEQWGALREALTLLGAIVPPDADPPEPLESALAEGRLPRRVLHDWPTAEWILESLGNERDLAAADPAHPEISEPTRQRVRQLAGLERRRPRLWQVAAALVALAVLGGAVAWNLPADESWAAELALKRGRLWSMGEPLRGAVAAGLDGRFAEPAFMIPPAPLRLERDAFRRHAPIVESPRWQIVDGGRPTFAWQAAGGDSERFEVVLLDADRRFLWSASVESSRSLPFPDDQPPLVEGATYYWKVNQLGDGEPLASAYVGMRTLSADTRRSLEQDLRRAGKQPFVRGIVYDRYGLYDLAESAFSAGGYDEAVRAMRRHRGLDG